jgi:hypothetical protein
MRSAAALALAAAVALPACRPVRYEPALATRPYPQELGQGETIQVQVLNEGDVMVVINATPRRFENVDLWLNQRYMCHVDRIAPGETLRLSFDLFWDVRGEGPNPGGALRYFQPTPIRLAQIQIDPKTPLIGLVAVPMERELAAK